DLALIDELIGDVRLTRLRGTPVSGRHDDALADLEILGVAWVRERQRVPRDAARGDLAKRPRSRPIEENPHSVRELVDDVLHLALGRVEERTFLIGRREGHRRMDTRDDVLHPALERELAPSG